jgi:hypothetical protein
MGLRIVLVEPLAEVRVALIPQAGNDARPIEPRRAVIALLRVRQIHRRVDGPIGNQSLRKIEQLLGNLRPIGRDLAIRRGLRLRRQIDCQRN